MKKRCILLAAVMVSSIILFAKEDGDKVKASLTSVTVYRSGAEMVHTTSAVLKTGNNDVVIENISNDIDVNSLQIKAPSTVTILRMEFSNNYLVPQEKTPHILLLEDSLENTKDNISKVDVSISNTNDLLEVLKANRNIKGEQSGLSVTELSKLMDYYQSKSADLQTTLSQLQNRKKKLTELADKIQQQISEEQKKNVSNAGRLTLQLNAAIPVKADFTISYIARNAYWTPYYDVRVDNIKSPAKLFYRAKIVQTTGIDWKQIKLALSTSTPSHQGNAPSLESWFLGYVNPFPTSVMIRGSASLSGAVAGVSVKNAELNEVIVTGYDASHRDNNANTYTPPPPPVYVIDGNILDEYEFKKIDPNLIKKMETLKGKAAAEKYGSRAAGGATIVELKSGLEDHVAVGDNALNITYTIDIPYDVPTNGKEQTATLQVTDIKALYEHYSIPKLDAQAYLLAQIPSWEKLNLLAGEANIISEGVYLGKTILDPSSTDDTLKLTLGPDKRVVVKREKLKDFSSLKFFGNNKLQKITYEITVKNNKNEQISFLLKDQYPLSTNKEIEVELTDAAEAQVNKDLGLLQWNFSLAPNETKKIRFSYSVKYPKDKMINID